MVWQCTVVVVVVMLVYMIVISGFYTCICSINYYDVMCVSMFVFKFVETT